MMTDKKKSGGGGNFLNKIPMGLLGGLAGISIGDALGVGNLKNPGANSMEDPSEKYRHKGRHRVNRPPGLKAGGKVKKKAARRRGDGIACKGRTRGRNR